MGGSKVIAVDLGGSYLRIALLRGNKILKYEKKETPKNKNDLIKVLIESIDSLMSKEVKGIGVASPGPLINGIIKNPPNIPLKNYNLRKVLKDKFKVRVEIENDASCVALAEAKYGCKKKNFFILTLGTGIGGGIIINGELYKGGGYAGELGYIVLDNGKSFEYLASKKRTIFLSEKYFGKKVLISDLIKMNDSRAKKIIKELSSYLGQGIASLINVFDPEVVVLAGGIREIGGGFLSQVKKEAYRYILLPKKTPIVWSKLEHPGILGAGLLIK